MLHQQNAPPFIIQHKVTITDFSWWLFNVDKHNYGWAHNLWERLKIHEVAAVLLFAKDPHVSFTNNRVERDLRMSKVNQKVPGCFRASEYAHACC